MRSRLEAGRSPAGSRRAFYLATFAVAMLAAGWSPAAPAVGAGAVGDDTELIASQIAEEAEALGALGVYWDSGTQELVLVSGDDDPTISASRFADRGLDIRMETAAFSKADFQFAKDAVLDLVKGGRLTGNATTVAMDLPSGRIEIKSTANRRDLAPVLERLAAGGVFRAATGDFQRLSRADDYPPYWGGAHLQRPQPYPYGQHCTSGFAVQKSGGFEFMVTAGHCFPGNVDVFDGGGDKVGTVNFRAQYPFRDIELIGGKEYAPYIYRGVAGAPEGLGRVTGASNPVAGLTYCSSGHVSLEKCGLPSIGVNLFGCDRLGNCTDKLAGFSGDTWWMGRDSGGPIFSKISGSTNVSARGIILFAWNGVSYGQQWSEIAAHMGVSICTVSDC